MLRGKSIIIALAAWVSAIHPLLAQDPGALSACRAIKSDLARLVCYDSLAATPTGAANINPTADRDEQEGGLRLSDLSPSAWTRDSSFDALEERWSFMAALASGGPPGPAGLRPALIIGCYKKKPTVRMAWGAYIGTSETTLRLRLDDDKPYSGRWLLSRGGYDTFPIYDDEQIARWSRANRLRAQVDTYREGTLDASWDLSAFKESVTWVTESCKRATKG
jgi:type VI secretion system VasI family protein